MPVLERAAVAVVAAVVFPMVAVVPPAAATETGELRPSPMDGIERQHVFEDIYLASQPSEAAFRAARESGLRTVINLRPASEQPDFDEAAFLRELGVDYFNPAFASAEQLSDDIFARTRALLGDRSRRPLMLHCSSANRVGAVWLAYRVLDEGVSVDEATAEARAVGLRAPALEQRALDYIREQRD